MSVVDLFTGLDINAHKEELASELLNLVRDGRVRELVIVANLDDDRAFFRAAEFTNAWHLLGALEYAKAGVLGGISEV